MGFCTCLENPRSAVKEFLLSSQLLWECRSVALLLPSALFLADLQPRHLGNRARSERQRFLKVALSVWKTSGNFAASGLLHHSVGLGWHGPGHLTL